MPEITLNIDYGNTNFAYMDDAEFGAPVGSDSIDQIGSVGGFSVDDLLNMSSEEQMEAFQNLSPDDQAKMMDMYDAYFKAISGGDNASALNLSGATKAITVLAQQEETFKEKVQEKVESGDITQDYADTIIEQNSQMFEAQMRELIGSSDEGSESDTVNSTEDRVIEQARSLVESSQSKVGTSAELAKQESDANDFVDSMMQDMAADQAGDGSEEDEDGGSGVGDGYGPGLKGLAKVLGEMLDKKAEELKAGAASLNDNSTSSDYMEVSANAQMFSIYSSSLTDSLKKFGDGLGTIARG